MKRYGFTAAGTQRWYCLVCVKTFCWKNPTVSKVNARVWFERWIAEGYSVRQLSHQSGWSASKIRRCIWYWLDHPPHRPPQLSSIKYLIIDGTYLYGRKGLLAVMDAENYSAVAHQYGLRENSRTDLEAYFRTLAVQGLALESATIDGNPAVAVALKRVWPGIQIQRCLVHIQRQGLMWCRHNPKRTDAKKLRTIFLKVANIQTKAQAHAFLSEVAVWERRYGPSLAAAPERGWVISDLKRARSMLLKALPHMFLFLGDDRIARTTNGLEGYFARLKMRYRQHRGLSPNRRQAYFQWYFFLKPR